MRLLTFIAPLLGARKMTKLQGHEEEALGDAVAWCVAHGGTLSSVGGSQHLSTHFWPSAW